MTRAVFCADSLEIVASLDSFFMKRLTAGRVPSSIEPQSSANTVVARVDDDDASGTVALSHAR